MSYKSAIVASTILGSLAFIAPLTPAVADQDINTKDLLNLSLEQLSNIEVTSVSKRSEKASEAAAAIFVITQDDIRRSGATSIPEVLRIVPGLSVAQSGSHEWAISSRGATGQFANKLLVLIDGRSVYTPLFSGVYWDVQDTPMQDIERIEVIRGPGATVWGANAVNGVINIITKSAKDTQGGLVSETAGNQEKSLTTFRYGAKDDDMYARVYAKYDDHASFQNKSGTDAKDPWTKAQSGFRADGGDSSAVSYTVQGDAYRAGEDYARHLPTLAPPFSKSVEDNEVASGANVLGRINYKNSSDSDWTLQMYFDNTERDNHTVYDITNNTFDIDLQQAWKPNDRNEVVWGLGYRLNTDDSQRTLYANLAPASVSDNLFSSFAQDKIALVPDSFFLTLGSKFEHNDYSGFEVQPSAKLTWLVDSKQTWWSSVSHAVHTPYRFSDDGSLVLATEPIGRRTYAFVETVGQKGLNSEQMNAYETGYRIQPVKSVSLDVSAFYNHYDKLFTNNVGKPQLVSYGSQSPYYIVPVTPINGNEANSHGAEVSANWEVTSIWQLSTGYSWLNFKRERADQLGFTEANAAPPNQANLRSALLLPHNVELDNTFYYVDDLAHENIPAYVRVDARAAWKPIDGMELSLVGQNLFKNDHPEFSAFIYQNNAEVPRSIYGNVTWKF